MLNVNNGKCKSVTRQKALSVIRNVHTLYAAIFRGLMQHQIDKNVIDDESRRTLECLCDQKLVHSEYRTLKQLKKLNFLVETFPYILDSTYEERYRQYFAYLVADLVEPDTPEWKI